MTTHIIDNIKDITNIKVGDTIIGKKGTYIVPTQPKIKLQVLHKNNAYDTLVKEYGHSWQIINFNTYATIYTYLVISSYMGQKHICIGIKKRDRTRNDRVFKEIGFKTSSGAAYSRCENGDHVFGVICPGCGEIYGITATDTQIKHGTIKTTLQNKIVYEVVSINDNDNTAIWYPIKYLNKTLAEQEADYDFEDIDGTYLHRDISGIETTHACGCRFKVGVTNYTSVPSVKITKHVTDTHARYHTILNYAFIKDGMVYRKREAFGVTFRKKDLNMFTYVILPKKKAGVFTTNMMKNTWGEEYIWPDVLPWLGISAKGNYVFFSRIASNYKLFRVIIKTAPRLTEELFKNEKMHYFLDDKTLSIVKAYKGDLGLLGLAKERYGRGATINLLIRDIGQYSNKEEKLNNELGNTDPTTISSISLILSIANGNEGIIREGGYALTSAVVSKIARAAQYCGKTSNVYRIIRDILDISLMCSPLEANIAYHTMTITQLRRHHDRLVERGARRHDVTNKDLEIACVGYEKYNTTIDEYEFRAITTLEQLEQEGATMHHCVASYSSKIAKGQSVIISIKRNEEDRATMEVSNGTIVQIRGDKNGAIPRSLLHATQKWASRFHFDIARYGYSER